MTWSRSPDSRLDLIVWIVLACAIVISLAVIVSVATSPKPQQLFTEFYILGPERVAIGYPSHFRVGEENSLIIGVSNREGRPMAYSIEVYLSNRTSDPITNETVLREMALIDSWKLSLPDEQRQEERFTFVINDPSYNRFDLLLFNESVPGTAVVGEDRIRASYRHLYLWVRVREER